MATSNPINLATGKKPTAESVPVRIIDREKMEKLSDFSLKTSESETIACHKLMLAQCSDVFNEMFTQSSIETKMGQVLMETGDKDEILIEDFAKVTVEDFVNFVYDGKLEKEEGYTIDLLLMADKYKFAALKDVCSKYLAANVTKDNVAELWEASEHLKIPELQSAVHDFLQKGTYWMSEMPGVDDVVKKHPGFILDLYKMCKITVSEQEAKLTKQEAELTAQKAKLAEQEAKLTEQEAKLTKLGAKLTKQEAKLTGQAPPRSKNLPDSLSLH